MVAIYIIVVACVVNLSLGGGQDTVWASMLSASIGYLLPAPKFKKAKMTHFYLTLPSNSSQQYYPDNTMTDFTTKLASPVELTGDI